MNDHLSKREQFAIAAMNGLLASKEFIGNRHEDLIEDSVKIADMLIERLNKTNKDQTIGYWKNKGEKES